ncbi:phosphatase PAP2 family protein [Paenibacillus sp. UNC499MF]|uniref:phosphatase PAP2 family protein n=1 Tax=Paenibacillus sp. UNC499MF TaxID=1502751 RepID=UPI0008A01A3E|nr:phosphatase PAP2 family protein [Paenibacillus sp. UNC499MF]SEG51036.1 undecaprenyl-diphosphatase [Paenibacillus sp. UNC499MF]
MNTKLNVLLTRSFLVCLFLALCFGMVALLVSRQQVAMFDETIISFVQGAESPGLTAAAALLSEIGSSAVVPFITIAAALYLYFVLKHRSEVILLIAAIGGSAILNTILKKIFQRERPTIKIIMEEAGFSFPSGHSMAVVALYGILVYLLWKHISSTAGRTVLIVLASAMIVAMGLARIYLGVHYPSDVLGGYLASGFWLAVCIWTYRSYRNRRRYAVR